MKCKNSLIRLFSTLAIFSGLIQLYAQAEKTYQFVNYSNREGFNQNTVISIEQDKTGTLWVGTSNGLIKYNGNSFQNISWEAKHLSYVYHGPISSIHSDSKGLLWIVSRSGLNIYSPDMERFFKVTSDSLDMLLRTVEDSDGSMWVMGNKYLSNVSMKQTKDSVILEWTPNLLTGTFAELEILDLLEDENNEDLYLLATSTGLYKMSVEEEQKKVKIEADEFIPSISINCLNQHNSITWIGTEEGLYKTVLEGTKLRLLNKFFHQESNPQSLAHNHVSDILVDHQNRMWVGTWLGGLSLYNDNAETFSNYKYNPRKKGGISGNMINCIYEDPYHVLWIGTAQAGLCKLDLNQKQFTNLENDPYDDQTISGNLINCVLEDSEGYLWISSYNLPLCKSREPVSENNISALTFDRFNQWFNAFDEKNIISIYEDNKGYIWLGYEDAVVVYNKNNRSFSQVEFELNDRLLPVNWVRNIVPLDHEKILVAGSRIIVIKDPWSYFGSRDKIKIPIYSSYSFDDTRAIISVTVENPERIWIGFANKGLSRFSMAGESLHLVEHFEYIESDDRSISNNAVFCINKDQNQSLWIGTFGGGLNRLLDVPGKRDQGFERLQDTIGLADNAIYGIIEENDTTLWCATDMGISVVNTRTFETRTYNIYDGLPSNNFRQNASLKGRSGFYYFGGLNGLTAFKPAQIKDNLITPEIRLTDLKINNKIVPVGETLDNRIVLNKHISEVEELILTRNDRTVSFGINVYHTAIPEKNHLAYKLEGFDKEWIHINQGSFSPTYTNLTPGDYIFKARGYNCDGIISEEETTLPLTMQAPWFARPISKVTFILLTFTLILGLSRYVVKLKNLQNKLHFEQLDKERIQEVNKSKLRFFTNISHEFKTPLTSIRGFAQAIIDGAVETEADKQHAAQIIIDETGRSDFLVNDLLLLARLDAGTMILKKVN